MLDDDHRIEKLPPSHPLCRRFELPRRQVPKLPVAADHWIKGILRIECVDARPVRGDTWDTAVNQLHGVIRVTIDFVPENGPLKDVRYAGEWYAWGSERFSWPKDGEPLPILVELKRTKIDGKIAASLVAIERYESFGHIS